MQQQTSSVRRSPLLIAVLAVVIIAGSTGYYLWSQHKVDTTANTAAAADITSGTDQVRPVQTTDHVLGNPAAPIVFVVYSDFECPYCQQFYQTMRLVIQNYGKDGNVAWVFRHMPIQKAHPRAPTYALASECVAAHEGNDAFWKFADAMYATMTPTTVLSAADLTTMAADVGVPREDFTTCMQRSTLMSKVEDDFNEALNAGASETPFVVILTPYQRMKLAGARNYQTVAGMLEVLLNSFKAVDQTADPSTLKFSDPSLLKDPEPAPAKEPQTLPDLVGPSFNPDTGAPYGAPTTTSIEQVPGATNGGDGTPVDGSNSSGF